MTSRILLMLMLLVTAGIPLNVAAQSTPAASPAADPDTGPRFVLRPTDDVDGAYFTLEAEAGSTHTLNVLLGNADTEPLTLQTYAADAFSVVNGGYGVRNADERKTEVSTWLEYDTETMTIESGTGIDREFIVTVPDDAEPGQYIAGIVLQTAEPFAVEGAAMFDQIARKSIAVFIIVPGDLQADFELGPPEFETTVSGTKLVVPVENGGEVLVKPAGEVILTDPSGNEAFKQRITMGSVYAGMSTTLELPLPAALPVADYTVSVTLSDQVTSAEASSTADSLALTREVEGSAPLEITSAVVAPKPDADDIQFAAVSVTVENRDLPIDGARVVLSVSHDGNLVEDFVMAQSVTLQQGETTLDQRYIPLDGWSAGEWTFAVRLESVDPQSGAEAVLLTIEVEEPITFGDR